MLILSEAMTRELVDLDLIWSTIRDESKAQANGRVAYAEPATQVLVLDQPKARYRIKACALPDIPLVGIRIIGYPLGGGEHSSTRFVMLSDPATGEPLALVDDHWTYTLRTAASAVLGISHLTPNRPLSLGLVGSGNLAGATLMLLKHIDRLADVRVTSRRPESREAFARKWSATLGVDVQAVASVGEALSGRELVVTSTDARKCLVERGQISPGTTICTLGFYELSPDIYRDASKIVVDRWKIAKGSPDVKDLVGAGVLDESKVHAELHELVSGAKPGRERDDGIILFRTDGLVTQDVAIAYAVYKTALERGMGMTL
jgi:ornithine cyclodeaminase